MNQIVQLILILMSMSPNSRVVRDDVYRSEIATHIQKAADIYDVDSLWLTCDLKRESDFRSGVRSKSKHKEFGMCQVHGVAKKLCTKTWALDLKTNQGQIYCMAALLEHGRQLCGEQPINIWSWYVSGKCRPSKKVRKKYKKNVIKCSSAINLLSD